MEEIAKKKIELERVAQERAMFDEMKRRKNLEVEAINSLLGKSKADNEEILQRALKRADQLEKAMNSEQFGKDDR